MARKTRAAAAAKQAQKEVDEGTVGVAEETVVPEPAQKEDVKTTEEEAAEAKLTMEERMAKMKDLRKKMVSFHPSQAWQTGMLTLLSCLTG